MNGFPIYSKILIVPSDKWLVNTSCCHIFNNCCDILIVIVIKPNSGILISGVCCSVLCSILGCILSLIGNNSIISGIGSCSSVGLICSCSFVGLVCSCGISCIGSSSISSIGSSVICYYNNCIFCVNRGSLCIGLCFTTSSICLLLTITDYQCLQESSD